MAALRAAHAHGSRTIWNPAPVATDRLDEYFQFTDVLIPNETELRTLCGGDDGDEHVLARSLLARGVRTAVIVTMGAQGVVIVFPDNDTPHYVAAPDDLPCRDDAIVDTIGAGDSFCGALASYMSLLDALEEEVSIKEKIIRASKYACGYASMTVRRRGTNYPMWEELPDCLTNVE